MLTLWVYLLIYNFSGRQCAVVIKVMNSHFANPVLVPANTNRSRSDMNKFVAVFLKIATLSLAIGVCSVVTTY